MKIVVDENMPHAVELFAEFGEVVPLPGREIKAADLQEADVLLVRPVTRVNEALLASAPGWGLSARPPSARITSIRAAGGAGHPFFSAPAATRCRWGLRALRPAGSGGTP